MQVGFHISGRHLYRAGVLGLGLLLGGLHASSAAPEPEGYAEMRRRNGGAQPDTISDPRPEIEINLASFGKVDPKTVEMRISGFGLVPANYDPVSQLLSYKMHNQLRENEVTVIVSARAGGKKSVTSWTFHFDPKAKPAPANRAGRSADW